MKFNSRDVSTITSRSCYN